MRARNHSTRRRAALPAILLALMAMAGCTAAHGPAGIGQRAETAFREQNRLSSDLMMRLSMQGDAKVQTEALLAAEQEMLQACAPLNHIATLRRDNRRPRLADRLAASRAVPACEARAAEVDRLLHLD